jgi:hypothetical protein
MAPDVRAKCCYSQGTLAPVRRSTNAPLCSSPIAKGLCFSSAYAAPRTRGRMLQRLLALPARRRELKDNFSCLTRALGGPGASALFERLLRLGAQKLPAREKRACRPDDPYIAGFRDGCWIQQCSPDGIDEAWSLASQIACLAVPLSRRREVVLGCPNHPVTLDWEAFGLLRAAGRQTVSHLAQGRSTR